MQSRKKMKKLVPILHLSCVSLSCVRLNELLPVKALRAVASAVFLAEKADGAFSVDASRKAASYRKGFAIVLYELLVRRAHAIPVIYKRAQRTGT